MDYREEVVAEATKFDGNIIRVTQQTVTLPDGQTATRDIVYHSGAVAVVAITDDNRMILVEQWRAPIQAVTLEIPAGKIDGRDQDPLDTAKRELNEETRYTASAWEKIAGFYTAVGFSDEFMTLYRAKGLQPISVDAALPQDADENLNLVYVTFAEMTTLFEQGRLNDGKTAMAYLYWKSLQAQEGTA